MDAEFPRFLRDGYLEENREQVLQAVAYDKALSKAFDGGLGVSLAEAGLADPERIFAAPLVLAPHFSCSGPLDYT